MTTQNLVLGNRGTFTPQDPLALVLTLGPISGSMGAPYAATIGGTIKVLGGPITVVSLVPALIGGSVPFSASFSVVEGQLATISGTIGISGAFDAEITINYSAAFGGTVQFGGPIQAGSVYPAAFDATARMLGAVTAIQPLLGSFGATVLLRGPITAGEIIPAQATFGATLRLLPSIAVTQWGGAIFGATIPFQAGYRRPLAHTRHLPLMLGNRGPFSHQNPRHLKLTLGQLSPIVVASVSFAGGSKTVKTAAELECDLSGTGTAPTFAQFGGKVRLTGAITANEFDVVLFGGVIRPTGSFTALEIGSGVISAKVRFSAALTADYTYIARAYLGSRVKFPGSFSADFSYDFGAAISAAVPFSAWFIVGSVPGPMPLTDAGVLKADAHPGVMSVVAEVGQFI